MKLGINGDEFPVDIHHGFHKVAEPIGRHLFQIIKRQCACDNLHDPLPRGALLIEVPPPWLNVV